MFINNYKLCVTLNIHSHIFALGNTAFRYKRHYLAFPAYV